jgi:hypothetical protein
MQVKIEHIIDETSKEIYTFEGYGNTWEYTGIEFSNRNNAKEQWGEDWGKRQLIRDLNALGKKYVSSSVDLEKYKKDIEFYGNIAEFILVEDLYDVSKIGCWELEFQIGKIKRKWNPVANKTKKGEIRWSGVYFGLEKEPKPKLSKAEIKKKIRQKIAENMEIQLD